MRSSKLRDIAPWMLGKEISFIGLSEIRWEGEFGVVDCLLHFSDGSCVELMPAFSGENVRYANVWSGAAGESFEVIDGDWIAGACVIGVVTNPCIYSFGVVATRGAITRVLCLDTEAGVRLSVKVYPVERLKDDDLVVVAGVAE